jgi:imidazolonepropionase-like amidohydrolase
MGLKGITIRKYLRRLDMYLTNSERKARDEATETLIKLIKTEYTEDQVNFDKIRSITLQYSPEQIERVVNAMARFGPSVILNLIGDR